MVTHRLETLALYPARYSSCPGPKSWIPTCSLPYSSLAFVPTGVISFFTGSDSQFLVTIHIQSLNNLWQEWFRHQLKDQIKLSLMPLLILNFWLYKIYPVKYGKIKAYLNHAILCSGIQKFTKEYEMLSKAFMGGLCLLLNGGTKSFFPQVRFSVRMAAYLSGCLRDPSWEFCNVPLCYEMVYLITKSSP